MDALLSEGADTPLFAFAALSEERGGEWPRTNNPVEGGVNARIREMLRNHRGLSRGRRVKAAFWWCYMHCDARSSFAGMLKTMPTDEDAGRMSKGWTPGDEERFGPDLWGTGVVWTEYHSFVEFRR